MLEKYKIIITGEMGAGKTTAITTLSDTPLVSTEVKNNDIENTKQSTTVGMDYGSIQINPHIRLLLFGTPGQKRFSFMWDILCRGSLGTIILVKADSPSLYDTLKYFIDFFYKHGSSNIIVGVSHCFEQNAVPVHIIQNYIQQNCIVKNLPVIPCDPRNKESMLLVLKSLVALISADSEV